MTNDLKKEEENELKMLQEEIKRLQSDALRLQKENNKLWLENVALLNNFYENSMIIL